MIEFKPLEKKHLKLLSKWRSDPEINKCSYTEVAENVDQNKYWNYLKQQKDQIHFIILNNSLPIGTISARKIDYLNMKCNWAYYIGREFWGKKYANEIEPLFFDYVFSILNMNRLEGEIIEGNKIIYIHEKFGMRREGYHRQFMKQKGNFINVITMALLKKEWDLIKGKWL